MNEATLSEEKKVRIALASESQRKAADPEKSVWVEASAGTGKTKVLADRVLRLLLKGVAPAKILCLTYTKAAAVEMNTRIASRLSRWAVAEEAELTEELQQLLGVRNVASETMAKARKLFAELLDTPGGMKIQTIHSFCQEILKRFPVEARISPYFEVMDDREAAEVMDEIKSRLLKKIEEEPESSAAEAMRFITRQVSEFVFPKIMAQVAEQRQKITRIMTLYGGLDEMLAATSRRLGVGVTDNRETVLAAFFAALPRAALRQMLEALRQGSDTDRKKAVMLEVMLDSAEPQLHYDAYQSLFLTQKGEARKSVATKTALKIFPEAEELAAAEALRLQDCANRLAAVDLMAATRAVLSLAEDLIEGYNHFKKIHSKMDYEDLIVLTRELLESPEVPQWVMYKLDGGIENVLIDEAQDTSPDQWAIIRELTREFFDNGGAGRQKRTVFAVGDRKQSIYSFQGADPDEFERMRRHFEQTAGSKDFSQVNLEVSFRSTGAVLDVVNQVFSLPEAGGGVVPEGQKLMHVPARIGDGGRVELWPLVEEEEEDNNDVWWTPIERKPGETTSSRLARQIAQKIKKMVESGEKLASANRPLRYRDFMILVQRRNSFVEEMVRACKSLDVEVAGVDKIRLLEQIAVQDLISLGRFLLLPGDDLSLAEVLKSPLFGLDDDDLFRLCYQRGESGLWQRLRENEAYRQESAILEDLFKRSDVVRPFELYAYVLNKLGGRRKFVERMGVEVEDGLDEFMNLTLAYEQEHVPGLEGFVNWISGGEVEIKRELEQSEADAVRIMTVHGSKGLQAPVVILPDTVRLKSGKQESGLLLDGDLLFYPLKSDDYEENCKRIKDEEKRKALEEYRRLLYVAITRAEDRLCICGYRQKAKVSEDSWYDLCRRSLEAMTAEAGDGIRVYETCQQSDVAATEEKQTPLCEAPRWEWLEQPAPTEGPLSRPLSPSHLEEDNEPALMSPLGESGNGSYQRGRLIHKLLQFLPESVAENRDGAIRDFLRQNAPELPAREAEEIRLEVVRLLEDPQFSKVFGPGSLAEVPVMGEVDGQVVSGQIDRLVVADDEVWIVDFKTNRPAAVDLAGVPAAYRRQMQAYKRLAEGIYPGKKVKTAILWTNTCRILQID